MKRHRRLPWGWRHWTRLHGWSFTILCFVHDYTFLVSMSSPRTHLKPLRHGSVAAWSTCSLYSWARPTAPPEHHSNVAPLTVVHRAQVQYGPHSTSHGEDHSSARGSCCDCLPSAGCWVQDQHTPADLPRQSSTTLDTPLVANVRVKSLTTHHVTQLAHARRLPTTPHLK